MKFEHVQGSIVAMVTPFHADGSVNFDVLTQLLERQIAGGTDAILTLGTTGESAAMTHEEDASVVEHTLKVVNGRVPVIVGSGSNCTATQVEKSRLYASMGFQTVRGQNSLTAHWKIGADRSLKSQGRCRISPKRVERGRPKNVPPMRASATW